MQSSYSAAPDRCDCNCIHEDVVNTVRKEMLPEDILFEMATVFQLFSDSTRVKILSALICADMCVCDISVLLGMTKSAVSHQLRILRQANLVRYRKVGRVIYYSLADEHVKAIFREVLIHIDNK